MFRVEAKNIYKASGKNVIITIEIIFSLCIPLNQKKSSRIIKNFDEDNLPTSF